MYDRIPAEVFARYNLYRFTIAALSGAAIGATIEAMRWKSEAIAWKDLAIYDPLTNLHNRRAFDEAFLQIQKHASAETVQPVHNLLIIDIDHFKHVNDTHGHDAGDEVLKDFGANLQDNARVNDLVVRFGGEEFGIIAYRTTHDEALEMAEKLVKNINQRPRFGGITPLTASIGLSSIDALMSVEHNVMTADVALYSAKKSGRNRVVSFDNLPQIANIPPKNI